MKTPVIICGLLSLIVLFAACKKDKDKPVLSSQKQITSFSFDKLSPKLTSVIDETAKTITSIASFGTNVTALVPTIKISEKATVSPASGIAQNFTSPVKYTVTAEDGTTQEYTVTVLTGKNNQSQVALFNIDVTGAIINIDHTAKTIAIDVPAGTAVTSLKPVIEVSTKATVTPASGVVQNFTNPVKYSVTAEDGSKTDYTVTVNVAKYTLTEMVRFKFDKLTPVVAGTIDHGAGTINLTVPFGTDITSIKPTIELPAGASVSPTTAQNFSSAVKYTVTAQSGATKQYTVTVKVATNPDKPVITAVNKTKIEVGQELIITGTKLTGSIGFMPVGGGTTQLRSGSLNTAYTQVNYIVANDIPVGKYTIYIDGGSKGTSDNFEQEIEIVASTQAAATVTSISGTTFDIGDIITINGTNFASNATVALQGVFAVPLEIVSITSTQIKAKIPSTVSYTTSTWPYDLIIKSGGKEITWNQKINIEKAPAVITGINKTSFKAGDKLIISGNNLSASGTSTLKIFFKTKSGSTYVTSIIEYLFGNVSNTSVEFTFPADWNESGVYYVSIKIDNMDETSVFATPFTFTN